MNTLAAKETGPDLARLAARLRVGGTVAASEASVDTVGITLMEQIYRALMPLAAGGAWPGRNTTEPPVFPYITFFRVSSSANISFDGPSDMTSTRIQIDCFGNRYSDAASLVDAATARMLQVFDVGAIDSQDFPQDPETYSFRCSTDVVVWSPD